MDVATLAELLRETVEPPRPLREDASEAQLVELGRSLPERPSERQPPDEAAAAGRYMEEVLHILP